MYISISIFIPVKKVGDSPYPYPVNAKVFVKT